VQTDREWHFFYLCQGSWTPEREHDITPNFPTLLENEPRDVYFHAITTSPLPEKTSYFFSNPRRAAFVMGMEGVFKNGFDVTPQTVEPYAAQTIKTLKTYYTGRLTKSDDHFVILENFVLVSCK
jgi:hypothetical protein